MNPDRVTNNQSVELSVRGLLDNIYKELVIWHTGCNSPCQLVSLCKPVQMRTVELTPRWCPCCRLFSHSDAGKPLVMLHEVDLCVVGVSSLAFGGPHHTSLAVGSMEATTHMMQLTHSPDGLPEPPQVTWLAFPGLPFWACPFGPVRVTSTDVQVKLIDSSTIAHIVSFVVCQPRSGATMQCASQLHDCFNSNSVCCCVEQESLHACSCHCCLPSNWQSTETVLHKMQLAQCADAAHGGPCTHTGYLSGSLLQRLGGDNL